MHSDWRRRNNVQIPSGHRHKAGMLHVEILFLMVIDWVMRGRRWTEREQVLDGTLQATGGH